MNNYASFYHGASMVLLDGLGVGQAGASATLRTLKNECTQKLLELIPTNSADKIEIQFIDSPSHFGVPPFVVEKGSLISTHPMSYALNAPTTGSNVLRVLRGMQLPKALLLVGISLCSI